MKYKVCVSWLYNPEYSRLDNDSEEYLIENLEEALMELIDRVGYLTVVNSAKVTKIEIEEVE